MSPDATRKIWKVIHELTTLCVGETFICLLATSRAHESSKSIRILIKLINIREAIQQRAY